MAQNQTKKVPSLAEEKLREFALSLVKQKNFQGLDQATLDMLVEDVYDRLEERVNAVTLAALPPAKLEAFEKLLDSGSKKEIEDFCEKYIPNSQELMTQALVGFQKTYLGVQT